VSARTCGVHRNVLRRYPGRHRSQPACQGGDLFVDSSVSIARVFRVPRLVIGGTLVSLATTTPELLVSVLASVDGDSGIALGNAVGSCICNIGLIVGVVSLLTPVDVDRRDFMKRSAWMVSAAVLVIAFPWEGVLSRPFAMLLLALSLTYLAWDYIGIRRCLATAVEGHGSDWEELREPAMWFLIGALLIVIGGRLLVDSGQLLAAGLGVPSVIIALSVVAIGTSLPELVTGVSAARKGVADLSIGNIIGANVLNLYLIVGISGTINPLTLDYATQLYWYCWLGVVFAAIIWLIGRTGHFHRGGGALLLCLYFVYIVGLFVT